MWHLYVIKSQQRDELQQRLSDSGIGALIHYPVPPHLQKAYAENGFAIGDFPIAEKLAKSALSLPIGPQLAMEQQVKVVAALLND